MTIPADEFDTAIATCSYKGFQPVRPEHHGVPVKTSIGTPRFKLGYTLYEELPAIMPFGVFGKEEEEASFRRRYYERLEAKGVDKIGRDLMECRHRHPGQRLVLLCYCTVSAKPDGWCHRRMFAEWFAARTGLVIPELTWPDDGTAPPPPPPPPPEQGDLFASAPAQPSTGPTQGRVRRPGGSRR